MNYFNTKLKECESFSCVIHFTEKKFLRYPNNAFAKSKASRGKLNRLQANSSTPLNRAFFVRRFHTPQENRLVVHQSMMACSRQPLMVGCFPVEAVFHPATRYRQSVERLAIAFNQLITTGLLAMIYKFLLLGKKRLKIAILANSEQEARQFLNLTPQDAICFARIKGVNNG